MTVNVISRQQWGASPWRKSIPYTVAAKERTEFFVHYHGAPPRTQVGPAVPRNVEIIHLANGWSGTGYNFMVGIDGATYEGRGWNMVGAHCPNHNRQGIGVYVAIGGEQEPSEEAKTTVRALYDEGCERSNRALAKLGHRDGKSTACPGEPLYSWVRAGLPAKGLSAAPVAIGDGRDSDRPVLVRGTAGRHVETLQVALVKIGYKIKVDGDFGPATEMAVRDFQSKNRLTVDGAVGPATYALLSRVIPDPVERPIANPTDRKEIDMFLVDDPGTAKGDSGKQWLCDAHTRRHVLTMEEVRGLLSVGVPHLTEKPATRTQRAALLAARSEVK